ncbi:MAG: hypothetical protein FAF03_00905 [Epsilonproteobacteria bacterium]|nr:hypothetical protein [Campylobacterota bacterium]
MMNDLYQVFKEIANNLKNSMIRKRIQNYNIIKETGNDDLLHQIEEKANLILKYTHDSIFDVHSFVNNAIFLMENMPQGKINSNEPLADYQKQPTI